MVINEKNEHQTAQLGNNEKTIIWNIDAPQERAIISLENLLAAPNLWIVGG